MLEMSAAREIEIYENSSTTSSGVVTYPYLKNTRGQRSSKGIEKHKVMQSIHTLLEEQWTLKACSVLVQLPVQKFGVGKVFWKNSLTLTKAAFVWSKIQ